MHQASVAAGLVAGLLEYVRGRGADADALAARAGIVRAPVPDPDARVPLPRYLSLLNRAQEALGDPALALHHGADVAMAEVSVVGLIMEAAPTMGEALHQLQRYGRLALDVDSGDAGPRFELHQDGSRLLLVETRPVGPGLELVEEAFARLVCGPRRFLDRPHVLSVEIAHPAPPHSAEYERVLGCPVRFGASRTALELDPQVASWPVAQHPRYVFGVLRDRGEALLAERAGPQRYRERVEAAVRARLHEGGPGADAVAEELHCSRSTLFRRLREEGTSYRHVVDDLRRDLAVSYLRAGRTSVGETAYLVGFSDAASFSRTFRRWTGTSPGTFRTRSGAPAVPAPETGRAG